MQINAQGCLGGRATTELQMYMRKLLGMMDRVIQKNGFMYLQISVIPHLMLINTFIVN